MPLPEADTDDMATGAEGEGGFEPFEHTADVGLRVWAPTPAELFEQAAAGLAALMFDTATVRPQRSIGIAAEGEEPEDLLVAWLGEVVFAYEVEGFVPGAAKVTALEHGRAEGRLTGEPFDPARHERRHSIKAVTYHDLEIQRTGDGYEVSIVFDV